MGRKAQYEGFSPAYELPQSLFQLGRAADSSTDRPADASVARLFRQKLRQPGQESAGLSRRGVYSRELRGRAGKLSLMILSKDQASS